MERIYKSKKVKVINDWGRREERGRMLGDLRKDTAQRPSPCLAKQNLV